MRHLLLLFSCLLVFSLGAQTNGPDKHGCHFMKQKADAIPLSPEQKEWLQASLERSDTFDILHYDITLDLTRFDDAYLLGVTTVDFRAKMDSLDYINLDLEGLDVTSINNSSGVPLSYTHIGPLLKIELDTVLDQDEEYNVTVSYEGQPISYGFGGFYFENGYAYNLGIGLQTSPHNLGRAWFPCFDNFVERSTYTYNVISHDGRRAFPVGTFISEDTLGGDTLMRKYHMMQPIPTYLSHVAVSNYSTVDYVHQGKYGAIPVQLVAKHRDTTNVRESFSPLGETIDCLEDWYGPYPFERVGYNITSRGAMEHPTAVAYPASSIENGNTNLGLITHELCHHWWGNLTTLSTEFDMWIKEGPASYSEHQIIECMQGKDAFEQAVRANNVSMIISAHIADDGYHPLSPMPDEQTYGRTTYDKGAAMIHNLRGYLGDSLFRIGMQNVLTERSYESINAYQFRDQLEQSTGMDLHPFFDNWIFSPGWSDFYVDAFDISDGGDSVLVTIKQGIYATDSLHTDVPMKIGFYHPDHELHIEQIVCSGPVSMQAYEVPFTPKFVYANPDQHLNLASAGDLYQVNENGFMNIPSSFWRLSIENLEDPYDFQLTHHWISPEDDVADTIPFKLSSTHFWTVNTGTVNGVLEATIDYNGGTDRGIDFDLLENTEDSLILLYRANGNEPWLEYPYYTKEKILPNDGRGKLQLDKILSGQYAFANGPSGIFLNADRAEIVASNVYPNPAKDQIKVELDPTTLSKEAVYQIFSLDGKMQLSSKFQSMSGADNTVNISQLPEGIYLLEVRDRGKLISVNRFIKS